MTGKQAGIVKEDDSGPPLEDLVVEEIVKTVEASKPEVPPVSFFKLLSTADGWDIDLMIIGTIGAIGNGTLLPIFAILFGEFTDAFGIGPDQSGFMRKVSNLALKFLYLGIGAILASYIEAAVWMYTGNRQANRLRKRFLAAVLRQDVAFFDVQSTTGGLVQGLNEDSIDVQNAISEKLGAFLHHSSTFITGFVIGFVKGWEMALVMLGCMPFLALIGGLLAKGTAMANNASSKAYAEASAIAQQSISQIRTVAAYNREQAAMEQYDKALEGTRKMALRQGWLSGVSFGSVQFVMYGTYAVGLFFGAYRVAAGAYTGGTVLMVLVSTLMGGFSLGQAAPNLAYFAKGRAAGGRMFSVIERVPVIGDDSSPAEARASKKSGSKKQRANGGIQANGGIANGNGTADAAVLVPLNGAPVRGEIELRNVDFAYPSRPDVLIFRDFSLHVPAGKTVALVGSSGSGKSTVVQLIERFYDPLSGTVTLDGLDLRSLPLLWLRNQVGLVSQEPTLFATSIFENIAIGLPGASTEQVEAAARAANAHAFIHNLPQGYETQVGERGVQLSGGQKQRIAIARAILKSPKVMLLDEATSALDTRSEAIVQAALDRLVVGRTTVVVAHRLSTIKDADAIAVVQGGRVVELGTHEGLLKDENGAYSILVKLQMHALPSAGEETEQGAPEDDIEEVEAEQMISPPRPGAAVTTFPSSVDDVKAFTAGPASATSRTQRAWSLEMARSSRNGVAAGGVPTADAVGVTIPNAIASNSSNMEKATNGGGGNASAAAAAPANPMVACSGKDGGAANIDAKEEPYKVPLRRLLGYAKGRYGSAFVGCVASAAGGAQHPAFAFVIASMIGIFYNTTPSELKKQASFYCWMFFVIACGAFLALLVQQIAFGRVAQVVSNRVRVELFGAIIRQEVGWFDDPAHSSGKLTANLATDAAYVRGAVGDAFAVGFQNLSTLALGYLVALAYDWRMALLITGVFPFITLSMLIHLKFHTGFSSDADKLYAGANQMVTEAFSSIRVIHAYNLQSFVSGTYGKMIAQANRMLVRQSNVSGISFAYSNFVMFAMYSLIIYFMGQELKHNWVDFDKSLKAFMAILLAAMGMAQATMSFPDLGNAKSAVQRIFPIIDRKPTIDSFDEAGAKPDPETIRGEIEFRDVRFAYPARPSVIVFHNFSLTVAAGQVTALVGESGSGKSTVVGLIERFYEPQAGSVTLDGLDLRSYNLKYLRAQVGLVSQEPLLFNGTISDNIKIGKADATQEELEAAAEAANARTFIEALPEKFNTRVGEGGIQLSGGQKQRIAIARAVVKNPKVMLLDEATSALDARSESVVQAALDRIMCGRTSIVIAHRLSTIRNANTIAVVYRGHILEKGTHEELMALPNGSYARLVAAQNRDPDSNGVKGKGASGTK
ncbi:hypothetical protein VaNZ11_007082 [Volvox africanus]|uniref:Uncharacterized protein n=1 Tax=Volvox africanus TaxID=51714 RepID=A0ABQ5S2Q6_9CHLO|nr:hypothetical protein VaNZ11_007082 [Volvox africanus]